MAGQQRSAHATCQLNGLTLLPQPEPVVEELKAAIYSLEASYRATGALPPKGAISDPNSRTIIASGTPDYFNLENIPHLGQCFLDYITHPLLLGVMEEMVGCRLRLEQSDAHIRRQPVDASGNAPGGNHGFHGGRAAELGRVDPHTSGGLYRFPFVKTLANLTDLDGPDDGGTLVIAGSRGPTTVI